MVKYGDPVTLSCTAVSNEDVKWTQTDTVSYVWDIYSNGAIFENIRNRFSIKTSTPSQYDLVMERANTADAGHYVCDERNLTDGSRTVLSEYFLVVPGNTILFLYFLIMSRCLKYRHIYVLSSHQCCLAISFLAFLSTDVRVCSHVVVTLEIYHCPYGSRDQNMSFFGLAVSQQCPFLPTVLSICPYFGSQPSDHYFGTVCLSVCLCRVFLSRL